MVTLCNWAALEAMGTCSSYSSTECQFFFKKLLYLTLYLFNFTETLCAFVVHPLHRRNGNYTIFTGTGIISCQRALKERERVTSALSFCSWHFN